MSDIPADLRFAESHEWARLEADGTVTVGISDHAQEALGDVVFVELTEVGNVFAAGDQSGVVESVKAVSELYSPVTGEVVEVNEDLTGNEGTINSSPYEGAWMIKVRLKDTAEVDSLLTADAYKTEIGE